MPFQLTPEQVTLLGDTNRVGALAAWIIGQTSNHVANRLCQLLGIQQGSAPTLKQTAAVKGYLCSNGSDKATVARLINAYHLANTAR